MPVRQTDLHLANEDHVASEIAVAWECHVDKLKPLSLIDRLCFRVNGNYVREYLAAVEIKCRNCKVMAFPTFFISEQKVKALRVTRILLGVSPIIVVRWTNVIGWFHADDVAFTRAGGREDRGDENDVEMMCHYKITSAKPLTKPPTFPVSV